ncbi:MAG: rod shape-determining protein MreC [Sulfurovaceae bacterium]|nr:rod shape-determining protein MreC [Sulfurovaceae bacterium]
MNKKIIFTVIVLTVALLFFKKEEQFQENFATISLPIKNVYLDITNSINGTIDKYISQADSIENLKKENILLRKYLYNQKTIINQLEQYNKVKVKKFDINPNIIRIQTLSYKKLNDFSYIYLTYNNKILKEDKIYGLIQKNVVAGIAIKANNKLEGILISNEKCQFSTFIGKKKMPGIAKGINENTMEVNFIPKWSKISVGDKVVTSGLDNIFLANIPVGTVSKVLTRSTYKTAIIKTYADVLHPNYFYLVKKVPIQIHDLNKTLQKDENNTID